MMPIMMMIMPLKDRMMMTRKKMRMILRNHSRMKMINQINPRRKLMMKRRISLMQMPIWMRIMMRKLKIK